MFNPINNKNQEPPCLEMLRVAKKVQKPMCHVPVCVMKTLLYKHPDLGAHTHTHIVY